MILRAMICFFMIGSFFHGLCCADPWFGVDKLRHFLASAVVTAAARHHLEKTAGLSGTAANWTALSVTFSLGTAKEVWDGARKQGGASGKDMLADGLGIGFGLLLP